MTNGRDTKKGLNTQRTNIGIVAAALFNDFELVSGILEDDPYAINEQNEHGLSAMMAAAGRGHLGMVQFLSQHPNLAWSLMDEAGRTALDHADPHPDVLDHIVQSQFGTIDLGKPEII